MKIFFEPQDLIKQAIDRHKNICVACSFHKDSIVVLHMALQFKPDILVLYHNTGVAFPEETEYKNMLKEKWNLNLVETKPFKNMTFWKCAKIYGLPHLREESKVRRHEKYKTGGVRQGAPRCCYYLKEKPAQMFYKENGIQAVITGLMAVESRSRRLMAWHYQKQNLSKDEIPFCAQMLFSTKWNLWKYHPIIHWTDEQVWDYMKKNKIPINPIFTKWGGIYKRAGCLPCTGYIGWEKNLSKSHSKLFRLLKKMQFPDQKELTKFGNDKETKNASRL